ncbi:MAG: PEGA domain-containing protein, partial [Persicimonas sp.]
GLAVCAGILTLAPSAQVPTASAQSNEDIEQAKKRFREGKAFYEDEDYLEAARAFEDAYDLSGRSELLYNVGRAYWRANRLKKAEQFFQTYLNELPDASNADEVVESIIEIQEEMAAQMADVEVSATSADIDIYVDDESQPRCQTPCTLSILAGSHKVTARPEGLDPIERTVEVEAEQQTSLSFDLPGRLEVTTDRRSATMTVAEQGSWKLPLDEPISLPAGSHDVALEAGDDAHWKGSVDVAGGETTRMLIPLSGTSGGEENLLRSTSYGLVGVSAGLLVGGIIMGMQASNTHSELQSQQQALGGVDERMVEQGRNEQFGANLLYGLSAATFASGAGLFAWDFYDLGASSEDEIAPSKDPSVEPLEDEPDEDEPDEDEPDEDEPDEDPGLF